MSTASTEPDDRTPPRRPTLVVAALAALAIAAVVVLVAAAHITPIGQGNGASGPRASVPAPTIVISQPPQSVPPSPRENRQPSVNPLAFFFLVAGLLGVVAGILIIIWLVQSTLRRRALPLRLRLAAPDLEAPSELAAEQAGAAVDRALFELGAGGPVDNAIIRCWLQLEAAEDAAGFARVPSDSPQEAVGRLFGRGGVRDEPLNTLADLYREARFSRHPMTEAHAERARVALRAILDDLRAGVAADGSSVRL